MSESGLTEALANEEALLVARDKIEDYLRDVNRVVNPESGANGYQHALRMFKEFLEKRPYLVSTLTEDHFDIALTKDLTTVISTRFSNGLRLNSSIDYHDFGLSMPMILARKYHCQTKN